MAFIVSGGSLDTSKPLLGALTGLAGGLAEGFKTSRQQQLAQAHLAIAQQEQATRQQEQALRTLAFQHGLQKESDIANWSRGLGEFKAWELAGGDPIQGPSAPQNVEPPGSIGPPGPTQVPGPSLGNAPLDPQMRAQKIADLVSKMRTPEQAKALESTLVQDHQEQVVGEHRDALLGQIRDARLKGAYRSKVIGGGEDLTGEAAALEMEKALSQLPTENPKEAAAQIDKMRADNTAHLMHVAESDTAIMQHDRADQSFLKDMEAQYAAGQPIDEATSRYNLWKKGLIPDEEMQKTWPDALHNSHSLKAQMALQENALRAAQTDAAASRAELDRYKATPEYQAAQDAAIARRIAAAGEQARQTESFKAALPARPSRTAIGERSNALGKIEQILQSRFPNHGKTGGVFGGGETPEEAAAYADAERKLRLDAGLDQPAGTQPVAPQSMNGAGAPGGTAPTKANAFLNRIRSGEFKSEDEVQKALKDAGLTEEEINAAAGG